MRIDFFFFFTVTSKGDTISEKMGEKKQKIPAVVGRTALKKKRDSAQSKRIL